MDTKDTSVDINSPDMHVAATVQRLTVFLVFKFVNRVMVSGCGYQLTSHYTCMVMKACVDELMEEFTMAKSTYGISERTLPKMNAVSNLLPIG